MLIIGKIFLCLVTAFCAIFGIVNTPDVVNADTHPIVNNINSPQYINSVYDNILNFEYSITDSTGGVKPVTQVGGTIDSSFLIMYNGVYFNNELRSSNISSRAVQFPSTNGISISTIKNNNTHCYLNISFKIPIPSNSSVYFCMNDLLGESFNSDIDVLVYRSSSEFFSTNLINVTNTDGIHGPVSYKYNYNTSTLTSGFYNYLTPNLQGFYGEIYKITLLFTINSYTAYSFPIYSVSLGTFGDDYAYDQGYTNGFTSGETQGYQSGLNYANSVVNENSASYLQGYQNGVNSSSSLGNLLNGVVSAPVHVVLETLDFEILGVSVGDFVLSIICIGVIVVVIKLIL